MRTINHWIDGRVSDREPSSKDCSNITQPCVVRIHAKIMKASSATISRTAQMRAGSST